MRITSKGQVTIPIEIRQQAGLFPNTEVEFVLQSGAVLLRKSKNQKTRGERLIEKMQGRATIKMTTDEIMALTRGED